MKHLFVLFALPMLAACAMQNPSFVNQQKMLVNSEQALFEKDADKLTKGDLAYIADDIKRRGEGKVEVGIIYPLQKGQERVASAQGNMIRNTLVQHGVRNSIHLDLQPTGKAPPNLVTISYGSLRASANCNGQIADADADNYTHATDNPYALGCSRDQYVAQMIARPEDLLGNDATSPAESQRLGKSLEAWRAGESATPEGQQSLSASDVYNQ